MSRCSRTPLSTRRRIAAIAASMSAIIATVPNLLIRTSPEGRATVLSLTAGIAVGIAAVVLFRLRRAS